MESLTQTSNSNANISDVVECSQEFKVEMENSICNYFEKCHLNDEKFYKNKSELVRDKTLIDNNKQDIEYTTPVPSLKGISGFMIEQIFSTDKIPLDYSSDEESIKQVIEHENDNSNPPKMNICNSDDTLNNELDENKDVTEIGNKTENIYDESVTISKSFATEFIDLLEINMKELKSKKDEFHVIGLKKVEEEKVETKPETPEVKIKEEFLDVKSKSNKRSKHHSILSTLERKCSSKSSRLFRSKSTNFKSSTKNNETESVEGDKLKKSRSKLGLSRIFRTVKKRMSQTFF